MNGGLTLNAMNAMMLRRSSTEYCTHNHCPNSFDQVGLHRSEKLLCVGTVDVSKVELRWAVTVWVISCFLDHRTAGPHSAGDGYTWGEERPATLHGMCVHASSMSIPQSILNTMVPCSLKV